MFAGTIILVSAIVSALLFVSARSGTIIPDWFPQRGLWGFAMTAPAWMYCYFTFQYVMTAVVAVAFLAAFSVGHGAYMSVLTRTRDNLYWKRREDEEGVPPLDNESLGKVVAPLAKVFGFKDGDIGYNVVGGALRGLLFTLPFAGLGYVLQLSWWITLPIAFAGLGWPIYCLIDNLIKDKRGIPVQEWLTATTLSTFAALMYLWSW
jgi:hypothetical protein